MAVDGTYASTNAKSRTWVTSLDSWVNRQSTSPGKDDGRHRDPGDQPNYSIITNHPDLLLGIDEGVMNEVGIDVYHLVRLN